MKRHFYLQYADVFMDHATEARALGRFAHEALALSKALDKFVSACFLAPARSGPPMPLDIEAAFASSVDPHLRLRIANATSRLGKAISDHGQPEIALVWLESAERMLGRLSGEEADNIACRHSIIHAAILRQLSQFDQAEERLDLAAQRMPPEQVAERISVAIGYAVLAQWTGRSERGIELLEELEAELDPGRYPEHTAWVWANLAMMCDGPAGRHREASHRLMRARDLLESHGSEPHRIADIDQSVALALFGCGDLAGALKFSIMALARNAGRPRPDVTWRALEVAAMAALGIGDRELSVLLLKITVQNLEAMRQTRAAVDPNLALLSLVGPSIVYDHLGRILAQQGRFGEAREVITLKLARSAAPDEPARIVSLTEIEERSVQDLLTALESQSRCYAPVSLGDAIGDISSSLDSNLTETRRQINALNQALDERTHRSLPDGAASDTLILHVTHEEDTLTLFAELDGQQIILPKDKPALRSVELNELTFNFIRSIRSGSGGERERYGKELYRLLISPLLRDRPTGIRRLLISAPGPLHALPWAVLTDGDTYLVECFDIVRATVPDTDLRRYPRSPMQVLACAANEGGRGFAPLAHVVGEVRALDAARVLDEADTFTRSGLAHALPGMNVLHLASHFAANPAKLTLSTLLLGDGTEITIADLAGLGLSHLDLVILSACETGSTVGRGIGQASFAIDHMLLTGRVPAVVATLFKIDDAATAELMRRFYIHLRSGEDKARALAMAQVSYIRGETKQDWRAPYFWAAPVLSGNWLGWH